MLVTRFRMGCDVAAPCYIAWNGVAPTTTAIASVATGTAIKTMLQIKPGTPKIRIVEWGYTFENAPTALVKVELIETGTVAATVTAHVSAGVMNYNDVTGPGSQVSLGTAATGYTSTNEGSVTASRLLAYQDEYGTQFKQQFPLGREPEINGGSILRIRMTTATTINAVVYCCWEE
jgi:hypothetical protein